MPTLLSLFSVLRCFVDADIHAVPLLYIVQLFLLRSYNRPIPRTAVSIAVLFINHCLINIGENEELYSSDGH